MVDVRLDVPLEGHIAHHQGARHAGANVVCPVRNPNQHGWGAHCPGVSRPSAGGRKAAPTAWAAISDMPQVINTTSTRPTKRCISRSAHCGPVVARQGLIRRSKWFRRVRS
jgi:hypothetical protein